MTNSKVPSISIHMYKIYTQVYIYTCISIYIYKYIHKYTDRFRTFFIYIYIYTHIYISPKSGNWSGFITIFSKRCVFPLDLFFPQENLRCSCQVLRWSYKVHVVSRSRRGLMVAGCMPRPFPPVGMVVVTRRKSHGISTTISNHIKSCKWWDFNYDIPQTGEFTYRISGCHQQDGFGKGNVGCWYLEANQIYLRCWELELEVGVGRLRLRKWDQLWQDVASK